MSLDTIINKRNTSKTIRILSHVFFWILLFTSSYFLIQSSLNYYKTTPLSYLTPLRNTIGLIVVFYPLMYIVIPNFLEKRRIFTLIVSFVILIFIYVFLEALGGKMVFSYCYSCAAMAQIKNPDYLSVIQKSFIDNILFKGSNFGLYFNLLSGLVLPIAIKSSLGYYQFYIKSLELEKENVQLELNFLKAQVNPHFLFNTLNNLYALIIQKRTEKSSETVTRLSSYMRYSLDNAHKTSILLSEEITLIKDYLELEKLRLNHTKVFFITNADSTNLSIPPLLFIPLIENAFKYNVDQKESEIRLELSIKENKLEFTIQNYFDESRLKNTLSGLGLKNLKKRLNLYFSDNYIYQVDVKNSVYIAYLKLNLK
ncbi:histidine kinase [Lutibacter sp. Hel_I_33_5]|uniref:sensor histidine kinase n=1 Tax=Lutibacter sp. Hel_I_33_5 TaxID=1566289 RepID=UPI0011ADC026|nr:sensor histidine kinase [Lutibacter sp. Hel_I_33_5]TVZ55009.1 histidine kinase [Lutibacter sp. Hel_I_33_5]